MIRWYDFHVRDAFLCVTGEMPTNGLFLNPIFAIFMYEWARGSKGMVRRTKGSFI